MRLVLIAVVSAEVIGMMIRVMQTLRQHALMAFKMRVRLVLIAEAHARLAL